MLRRASNTVMSTPFKVKNTSNFERLEEQNRQLRADFTNYKLETDRRITELEAKVINQNETMNYLLAVLSTKLGVNVFN